MDDTNASNVHYALFKGTAAEVKAKGGFLVRGVAKKVTEAAPGELIVSKKALESEGVHGQTTEWANTELQLTPKGTEGASQTYTLVVWLEENGSKNSGDQGKMFNAAIKFDTSAGGSGVTGSLAAAS